VRNPRARYGPGHRHLQGRHGPLPARSGPAPVGVTVVCSHGARPRRQPALSPHLPRPRPRRASAPLPAPVAAPVRFGSIPTARYTTAPVTGGTARPSTAVICPRRRRRVSDRITERLAPRKAFIKGSRYTTLPKSCPTRAGRLKAPKSRAMSNSPRPTRVCRSQELRLTALVLRRALAARCTRLLDLRPRSRTPPTRRGAPVIPPAFRPCAGQQSRWLRREPGYRALPNIV
jgi:hypothetical protein